MTYTVLELFSGAGGLALGVVGRVAGAGVGAGRANGRRF